MRRLALVPLLALLLVAVAGIAAADIQLGATAPGFTKTQLGGGLVTLSQYNPGKVVVIFLLGYS